MSADLVQDDNSAANDLAVVLNQAMRLSEEIAALAAFVPRLESMPDADVVKFSEMAKDARRNASEMFSTVSDEAIRIVKARLLKRGATEIKDPSFEKCKLEDQFTPYAFDIEKLQAAAKLLNSDDAKKVVKFVPETTTTVPAHYEAGNPVSIAAIIRSAGAESAVGKLLSEAMTRSKVDEKLVVKMVKRG
ncbi:MAG: hypothetical protein NVSMB31_01350 [Vulcanimicrobiaceae bacterium]